MALFANGRCIECEEIELARVRDARPTGELELPAALLAGDRGRGLTRRRVLRDGILGVAAIYGASRLGFQEIYEAATAEAAAADRCLVLLYLAGGNDGLNTVLPADAAQYAAYRAARPVLGRELGPDANGRTGAYGLPGTNGLLALANVAVSPERGGTSGGSGQGLDVLWGSGDPANADAQLAIMPAADYTPPNLSHFASSDYWFAGALKGLSTGWAGRWLDRYGSKLNPLQAVSLDSALSKDIRTSRAPVCAIRALSGVGFSLTGPHGSYPPPGAPDLKGIDATAAMAQLATVAGRPGNAHLARTRDSYRLATKVTRDLARLGTPPTVPGYPANSRLATRLRLAAVLLGANLGTRIVTVHWGSFDTHNDQIQRQDAQLAELSRCLTAFQADLRARGVEQRVATLVFSEFGRRVSENASAGTDHGAGGLMMLAGSAVRGGLASPPPSVTDLDARGNVKVQTDFRSVYRGVIEEWLGGDPDAVLPDAAHIPRVARADGTSQLFR